MSVSITGIITYAAVDVVTVEVKDAVSATPTIQGATGGEGDLSGAADATVVLRTT